MALIAQIISPVLIILFSNFIINQFNSKSDAQNQYPPGSLACKTHNMTEMDCSNRYLVNIPYLDHNLTTILDLSHNQLTEIKGAPFEQLPRLWRLDLSYNEISLLSSTAFRGIWFVVELNLGFNNIEALPSGIFFNLSKLESINMLESKLTTIPTETFELEALQEISFFFVGHPSEIGKIGFYKSNLKFFQLLILLTSNICNETFQNFAHLPLQTFYLYTANLPAASYVVEKGAFVHLSHVIEMATFSHTLPAMGSLSSPLQTLTLTSYAQSLTYVNKSTLQVLEKFNSTLSRLTIHYQLQLQRIDDDSFIWTPNLITLNLDNNKINYLAKYAFSGLITLQELNLASNDLKTVPSDALEVFRKSASLEYLDLSSNSISSNIPNDAISALSASLSSLKLTMKKSLPLSSITWVNKLQKLNHLLLESTGTEQHLLNVSTISTSFSLQKFDISYFYFPIFDFSSPCFAFPNLESLKMDNNIIRNFPADLALHGCSNLRVLSLSRFGSDINSFDEKHMNITLPFLHTLKITQNKVKSVKPILSIKAPKLKILDISNNLIKSIDIEIGQVFPNLIYLNISDNAVISLSSL